MEALCHLRQSVRFFHLTKFQKLISSIHCTRSLSGTENISENVQSESPEKKTTTEEQDTKIKILEEKNNELLDKYKRALADGENMRQRLTKQIQDAKIFGIQSFCKDLLEVADTLSQATKAVPKEEINNNNPHLKNLFDGVCGIKNSLDQVFRRHGLEIIDPLNSKFDPNFHEALFQKDCKDFDPGVVIEVTKVGYKLNGRCIRPALVGVSRN